MVLPISGAEVENQDQTEVPIEQQNVPAWLLDPNWGSGSGVFSAMPYSLASTYTYSLYKEFSFSWMNNSSDTQTVTASPVFDQQMRFDTLGFHDVYVWTSSTLGQVTAVKDKITLNIPSGSVYRVTAPVSVPYSKTGVVELSGDIGSFMRLYYNGTIAGGTSTPYYLYAYPDYMQIRVNGNVFGDLIPVKPNSTGGFGIDSPLTVSIPESGISSISLDFVYSSAKSVSVTVDPVTRSGSFQLECAFVDYLDLVYYEVPEYVPLIGQVIDKVAQLPQNIYNFFFQGVDPDSGSDFQSSVDQMQDEVDQLEDELNQLEKPEPEELVPDITDIVDQTDEYYVQYMDILAGLLSNSMITNFLLLVVSMAFVSYVLFGKKG